MNAKTTVPISEARKNIFTIAQEVQRPGVHYTLTANGRPQAVIISAEEFESWQETIEVMREFPDLNKDIAEAEEAFRTGDYKNWPTLNDLKKDWGFAVADKPTKKYGVHHRNKTKSPKKS